MPRPTPPHRYTPRGTSGGAKQALQRRPPGRRERRRARRRGPAGARALRPATRRAWRRASPAAGRGRRRARLTARARGSRVRLRRRWPVAAPHVHARRVAVARVHRPFASSRDSACARRPPARPPSSLRTATDARGRCARCPRSTAPNSIATTPSLISSEAIGPITCTPRMRSVLRSARIFTKPRRVAHARARGRWP